MAAQLGILYIVDVYYVRTVHIRRRWCGPKAVRARGWLWVYITNEHFLFQNFMRTEFSL